MMTTCEFLQACGKLDVSVRKKNMRLARFSGHFARHRMTHCVANVHGNHYTSTYFILSRLVIVSFSAQLSPSLSLRGYYFRKKNEYVSQHTMRVSTCIIHVQLAESRGHWSVINNDLSHLGGYIYSKGLVKAVSESLQELVRASISSMMVTLNNV